MENEEMLEIIKQMQNSKSKKPLKGAAKWLTLSILGLVFVVGVFGSFKLANFDMDNFVLFLDSFKVYFIPLVISIGVGGATKSVTDSIKDKAKIEKAIEEKESVWKCQRG